MIIQALFTFLLSTDFLNIIYPICKGVTLRINNNYAVKQKPALFNIKDNRQSIHIARLSIKNIELTFNGKIILK